MGLYIDYYAEKEFVNEQRETEPDTFGIRDIIVKKAIKTKKLIRIHFNGMVAIHDPKKWQKANPPVFRIWKYPDNPMRLFKSKANFTMTEAEAKNEEEKQYLII